MMALWIALALICVAFGVCLYCALIAGSDDDDQNGRG